MLDKETIIAVEKLINQVAQIDRLRQENKELLEENRKLQLDKAFWQKKAKEKITLGKE